MTVYLDTHVLIWIVRGEAHHISARSKRTLDNSEPVVSPATVLELELLYGIGRLKISAQRTVDLLAAEIGLRVCDLPFRDVVTHALKESWTRDPFDRLIVANAKAADAPLVTTDERILKHYRRAIW